MANTIYTRQNISLIDPNKYGGSNYDMTNGLTGTALEGIKAYNQQVSMKNAFDLGKGSTTSSGSNGFFGKGGAGTAAAGAALGMASSIGQSETNKRGLFDVMDPVHQLAGGRESAVGNTLGDTGVEVFKAGAQSGNPWFMLAGAGLKVVGGLTNALWGTKEDKEKRAAADRSIGINLNFVSNADYFDDIKGPATLTDTNIFTGGLFSGGKARRLNEEYSLNMANAFNWADRSIGNNVMNLKSNQLGNFLRGYRAYGGPIEIDPSTAIGYSLYTDKFVKDTLKKGSGMTNMFAGTPDMFGFGGGIYTKGANFDNGVSFINKGGTHELNPNEGVQMGVDSQGVPNLVEEGEVKWGDYMFSDRLIVPRGKRGNYGKRIRKYAEGGKLVKGKGIDTPYESKVLKPYEGLTFADAAKKILKRNGADERDDAITIRGIDAQLSVLAGILEKEREKEKLREMLETIDNMSPEEFAMLQQQMEAQQAALQQQEMAMQQLQMIPEGMELMVPRELMAAAYGGPIYELGGLLNNWDVAPAVLTSTTETPINENRYDFGSWLLKINPALYNEYLKEIKFNTDTVEPYIKKKLAENPNYSAIDDDLFPMLDDTNPLLAELKAFYEKATEGDAEEHWSNKVQTNVEDDSIRAKNFDDLTAADINNIFGWEASAPVERPSEGAISKEGESTAKVEGPEAEVFDFYNRRHPNEPKSAEQWNALDKKEKAKYIRAYRKTLKGKKEDFDKRLDDYNKLQELNDEVAKYQEQQRKSTLTTEDIKDLSYEDKVRLAKYMNPKYQALDLSKLSLNERDEAKKTLDEQLVLMSKDKGITLDNLSKNFATPQYHRDWKPVDAEQAWKDRPNEYDYLHPFYGGAHDVVRGNTEGKYQPRSWVNNEGKVVINAGDNTYTYDDLKAYELSDEYLKPRYELAKSAAAQDEAGLKTWNDYVNGLSLDYTASYVPTTVFGENYADNLGSYEDFKKYITANYDALNKANSGFFDLKAGQMHGMMLPTRQRELYQIKGNEGTYLTPEGNWQDYYTDSVTDDNKGTILHTLTPRGEITFTRVHGTPEGVEIKPDGTYVVKGSEENNPFPKPSNWPFGLAAALQLGSLGYNIFSPTDYSNADALLKASRDAGTFRPIEFRPLGTHHVYKADDPWFYTSPIIAQGNTTLNAIANKVAPSKDAETLLNSYNIMQALGNAARQQLDHNFDKKFKTTEANNALEKFWSEGFLKADMANQDAASRAAGYSLEGKRAAYAMRQAIDDAKANAINAGFSGLANLAYNYGTNRDQTKLLGWLGRSGANGPMDMSKYGRKFAAHGGRIRRKKGLSF